MTQFRIALAQINTLVGDIHGNCRRVVDAAIRARDELKAQLVVFPELTLAGYQPEDLLLRPGLYRHIDLAIADLCRKVAGVHVLFGHPLRRDGRIFNACSLLHGGDLIATYAKQHLPNYGVFDEKRYFATGSRAVIVPVHGIPCALTICEDLWVPGTATQARDAGARLILNLNASPYHHGKTRLREQMLRTAATEGGLPIVYVNLVGGQDELVFDGGSLVVNARGGVVARAPHYRESLLPIDVRIADGEIAVTGEIHAPPVGEACIYGALVLGVSDYVRKNGFKGAVIGLSGGIDSALTLAIATDSLCSELVEAVLMPSRYTAAMSIEDARAQADALGVRHHTLPIEPPFTAFLDSLRPVFAGLPADAAEENIQARCRGVLLMAISNKTGRIVLTTGNKSEMAVGYATLYGDMAGGFAPLKDVPKTLVYRLAEYRNHLGAVIPQRVFDRPPTAELRPDQRDEDSLPPYAILDPILQRYVEEDQTPEQIIAAGFERETVARVVRMVDRNEYKRRQAAPGVRVTQRAFGRDRRYPITSGYSELP